MKNDQYKQFDPSPGEVWQSSFEDDSEPTVYYFVEKQPSTLASARFGSSHHTWKVIVLESGSLEALVPSMRANGTMVERRFDGVSTGYGPPGLEHHEGWDSYDNCYRRLA